MLLSEWLFKQLFIHWCLLAFSVVDAKGNDDIFRSQWASLSLSEPGLVSVISYVLHCNSHVDDCGWAATGGAWQKFVQFWKISIGLQRYACTFQPCFPETVRLEWWSPSKRGCWAHRSHSRCPDPRNKSECVLDFEFCFYNLVTFFSPLLT